MNGSSVYLFLQSGNANSTHVTEWLRRFCGFVQGKCLEQRLAHCKRQVIIPLVSFSRFSQSQGKHAVPAHSGKDTATVVLGRNVLLRIGLFAFTSPRPGRKVFIPRIGFQL